MPTSTPVVGIRLKFMLIGVFKGDILLDILDCELESFRGLKDLDLSGPVAFEVIIKWPEGMSFDSA